MQQAAVGDLEAAAAGLRIAQHRRQGPVAPQPGRQHIALHDEAGHLQSTFTSYCSVKIQVCFDLRRSRGPPFPVYCVSFPQCSVKAMHASEVPSEQPGQAPRILSRRKK